jgi:gamma-glutamyltranspeptidase/glutathione hydrolase
MQLDPLGPMEDNCPGFWHRQYTMTQYHPNRRHILAAMGSFALAMGRPWRSAGAAVLGEPGVITGDPLGEKAGRQVLSEGGNVVDAVMAAAMVAGVTDLSNCGIGGYGGHMTLALANGKVTSIDFNSTAPMAAKADLFAASDAKGGYAQRGWISAGVPGTMAGIQLALDRYGTRSLSELLQPAIRYICDGFPLAAGPASGIRRLEKQLRKDPGSAKLLFPDGRPPAVGSLFRNPDLAKMLEALAEAGSVEPFYRGDIGRRIGAAFQGHGGMVTAADMAAYQAREVQPLHLAWNGCDIYTAPLTAGGATILEVLQLLEALDWKGMPDGPAKTHARLEAQRIAWHDRLTLFGDPRFVDVPLDRLLSDNYSAEQAERVRRAVKRRQAVDVAGGSRSQEGTCHISGADRDGNLLAMTLTHGGGFGAQVTVEGLGLILGHGVSRFDPDPKHPNAPGPGKRPLHNMCPTVVLRDGRPILALGGRGGRRIPNALVDVLLRFAGQSASMKDAVAAPRLHTEGSRSVTLETGWPETTVRYLESIGYRVVRGKVARVDAASRDPQTGDILTAWR